MAVVGTTCEIHCLAVTSHLAKYDTSSINGLRVDHYTPIIPEFANTGHVLEHCSVTQ